MNRHIRPFALLRRRMNNCIIILYLHFFLTQMGPAARDALPVHQYLHLTHTPHYIFPDNLRPFFFWPTPYFTLLFLRSFIISITPSFSTNIQTVSNYSFRFSGYTVLHPNLLSFICNSIEPNHTTITHPL